MNFFKPKFWDKNKISFFSIILFPISLLVKLLSSIKYHLTKTNKFPISVICVGNIYLGGTGKTPISIELFSILKNLKKNPAFIRKKYDSFQDEANLQKSFGKVYESRKRTIALNDAVKENINVAILDDGFQDFSIYKDFSIVCFNEKQWIGNGLTIPSGPLRENLTSLKRANCVIINGNQNNNIEKEIFKQNSGIKIYYINYIPINTDEYKNKKIIAFAGIGNPENFFELLKCNNINVFEKIKFPDHHNFTEIELKNLINKATKNNAVLLTTEKDYYRINENYKTDINCLKIKVKIKNHDKFVKEIQKNI